MERLERQHPGRPVQVAEPPPESITGQCIVESGDPVDHSLQRLLEQRGLHGPGKGHAHAEQRSILLRLARRIDEGGVVEPQDLLECHIGCRFVSCKISPVS